MCLRVCLVSSILINLILQTYDVFRLLALAQKLNLHAFPVKAIRLREVANAEMVPRVNLGVLAPEIEPLLVALSVCIDFAVQEILVLDDAVRGSLHVNYLMVNWIGVDTFKVA